MSQSYLAILGRQPELGLVELESVLGPAAVSAFGQHARLTHLPTIDRLGGTIKLGEIIYDGPTCDLLDLPINWDELRSDSARKLIFGLSYYGSRITSRTVTAIGLELKKRLRLEGPVRLITSRDTTSLSAAQLYHNHVLTEGFELLVVVTEQQMVVARTLGVQDIASYTERDYERPVRSARVGMLPPKLAQILLNTTHSQIICDPFCGTGVILQEALLAGRQAIGSDVAPEMVEASQTNLSWLASHHQDLPPWQVAHSDAQALKLPPGAAVVSEGYLGPALSSPPTPPQLLKLQRDLGQLYSQVLRHWSAQLPSGAEVSLCLPSWHTSNGWNDLAIIDELPSLGYTLKQFANARATPLRYARPHQLVGRSLLLVTKE